MEKFLSMVQNLTLSKLIPCLVVLVVGFSAIKILSKLFEKGLARSKLDKNIHGFLKTLFRLLLTFLVILIAASSLGIDVSSLIAVLSVASLAVSLAVQDSLANLAGGIMILATHPFSVGDWVELGGNSGSVIEVGLSHTTLRTADNKIVFVPNKDVAASRITNYSQEDTRRVDLTFTASYDSQTDAVIAALTEAASVSTILPEKEVFVRVKTYKESDIEYVVRVWTKNADYWDTWFAITENVKKVFDRDGIAMTYPHTIVHLEK